MSDLISRQAAIDAFLTELTKRERKNLLHTWSTVEVKYFVVDMLEKLPSAQPEIIRCKDCKHWETSWQNDYAPNYHYCPLVDGTRRDDFYCADAEMRGEA